MKSYTYQLQTYNGSGTRYHCPHCKQKTFVRYIDTETGAHLNPQVGRCNRESKCGYHYTPKQYFEDNSYQQQSYTQPVISNDSTVIPNKVRNLLNSSSSLNQQISHYVRHDGKSEAIPSTIPLDIFKGSLKGYNENHFIQYLHNLFTADIVERLVGDYCIGTSKHWKGATVFWQIDCEGNVRTGKVMLYSPDTGKRVKQPYNHITWAHSLLKQADYRLKQCLFGEHLLISCTKPVAIVESEKTAIIASVYLPQFVWLAVGSLSNLTAEKCSVLEGYDVFLFPDLNGYQKWSQKAEELVGIASFTVVDLLEQGATIAERTEGLDLADYLVRYSHKEFTPTLPDLPPEPYDNFDDTLWPEVYDEGTFTSPAKLIPCEDWSNEITELKAFFSTIDMATLQQPLRLNSYSTITDLQKYIDSHLATVKANNGKPWFRVYLERLWELRAYLLSERRIETRNTL